MTDDAPLRRDVLLALGATGAATAGAGVGSLAAFADREETTASFQAGGVDLVVHYEGNDETVTIDSGGVGDGPELTLPDPTEATPVEAKFCFELKGNPAYIWLCPGIDLDICSELVEDGQGTGLLAEDDDGQGVVGAVGDTVDGTLGELAEVLDLSLAYCDVNASEPETILNGSLCEFLGQYANGFPLDGDARPLIAPGHQEPFQPTDAPGSNPCLCLSLSVTGPLPLELGAVDLGLNLRFHAVQARHNDGETGPCATLEPPEPAPDPTPTPEPASGISFVAFCNSAGTLSENDVLSLDVSHEGGTPALTWATETAVEHVVLKSGVGPGGVKANPDRGMEVFYYPDGARSGTVRVGKGDSLADPEESAPCPEGETGVKIDDDQFDQYQ
jgi:predicted ribosomally synthesized peptide with SipW-like signal peptide